MGIRLEKPWLKLEPESIAGLPGQLGVFQIANKNHEIVYIGFAGGRSQFGLQGALANYLGRWPFFRVEVNMAYRTRSRELLMVHFSDHGAYPTANTAQETEGLGRLSIAAAPSAGTTTIETKKGK
ncbi:MAG: hypothetical protein ACNYPE_13655 [Candidatus Azotimanducaceae bacterium WSBS_2022_MAG_OTU7]